MDVFVKAAEYMEIPVRRTDNEPLQKLFMLVRSELNLDLKNIKQEQAKFWKQHPALVKVLFAPIFCCIWQLVCISMDFW
jgi:translocation protein SEC63